MKNKTKKIKGISQSAMRKLWRANLLCLYNGKCAVCREVEGESNLQCHHIIPRKYVLTRWDVKNGIVVCKKCHRFLHTLNGVVYLIKNFVHFEYLLNLEKGELTSYLKKNKITTQQHFKQQQAVMKADLETLQRG